MSSENFAVIQANPYLVNRVKSFKEIYIDFIAYESCVFHFDSNDALDRLYGVGKDADCPALLGKKLAHFCITLNEHPCIRFQVIYFLL